MKDKRAVKLPNFIIIGSSRAGTTSLYHFLNQHPDIYMSPIKETNYFAYNERIEYDDFLKTRFPVKTFEQYLENFRNVSNEKAVGEASPSYLHTPFTPKRIREVLPEVKLIAILRNPVERFYSSYLAWLRNGIEKRSIDNLIDRGIKNFVQGDYLDHYFIQGFYYEGIKRYIELFGEDKLKIFIFEDFKRDPQSLYENILDFLEVEKNLRPDFSINFNPSGLPRNRLMNYFLSGNAYTKKIRSMTPYSVLIPIYRILMKYHSNNLYKPELTRAAKDKLLDLYKKDICQLENLINRDLTHWLI